jgi:hypothetical protein
MNGIDPQRPGAHYTGVLGGARGALTAALEGGRLEGHVCAMQAQRL